VHGTRADGVNVHCTILKGVKMHGTRVDDVHVHGTIVKEVKGALYQSEWCACA
jgi:hypothetical protein